MQHPQTLTPKDSTMIVRPTPRTRLSHLSHLTRCVFPLQAAAAAAALAFSGAALAQTAPASAPEPDFTVSGNATLATDYDWRGLSLC